MRDILLVVTPSRNAERYLEQTILSVVQQRGDFEIRYHVQDGGSTDATLAIARQWAQRLREMGGTFYGGAPVQLSWDSTKDASMYDAVQTGFESLCRTLGSEDERRVVMTWINADDVFAVGAFQAAVGFLLESDDRHWVTGIPSTMLENGTVVDVRDAPWAYSRRQLALGWYDGRGRFFFQQEGTFWTRSLWTRVGGLNRQLQLAGDWDLWRRMAPQANIVTLRAVLAHHRRRPGQLSGSMGAYWSEVDALRKLDQRPEITPDDGDIGWVARWKAESGRWVTFSIDLGGAQETTDRRDLHDDVDMSIDFSDERMPSWVRHVSGLSAAESWGRWSDGTLAPSVRIHSFRPFPRKAVLRLKLAVLNPKCSPVVVTVGAQGFELHASTEPAEFAIAIEPQPPADVIDIRPSMSFSPASLSSSHDFRRLGVALHNLEISSRPEPRT